ncbi:hypothetical protein JXM67_00865 [candidate division WOR-3 bacterium]|nr:hypothetical protein [candidate division WOR-3 bacterium]
MNVLVALLVFGYPHGYFGVMGSSASDAGMALEKGLLAMEYNPGGLAWVDSLEFGFAGEGLFSYGLVGVSFKYAGWPVGVSIHHYNTTTGFTLAGSHLNGPFAWGGAFTTSIDSVRADTLSLRAGIQWGDYVGLVIGPQLEINQGVFHFSGSGRIGAQIPILPDYGLYTLVGGRMDMAPVGFDVCGGLAYEAFEGFLRIQSVVGIDEWGAGLILDNIDDRGGIWVRKGFTEQDWRFGVYYVRNVRPEQIREVVIHKTLPPRVEVRVDTVYITEEAVTPAQVPEEVQAKQDELMAKANRLYVAGKFKEAIAVWDEVYKLAPSTDLAKLALKNKRDVEALLETLNKMDSENN